MRVENASCARMVVALSLLVPCACAAPHASRPAATHVNVALPPREVAPAAPAPDLAASSELRLFAAEYTTCLVSKEHVLRCREDKPVRLWPEPVADVRTMALGDSASCAVRSSGALVCRDLREYDGLIANLPRVREVAMGVRHRCAITLGGRVWCWGENFHGELGIPVQPSAGAPRFDAAEVGGLLGAKALALGYGFSCALALSGEVSCWGGNQVGQLGSGGRDAEVHAAPQRVHLPRPAVALDAAAYRVCALLDDGALYCWGDNGLGELGGDTGERCACRPCSTSPWRVQGLPPAKAVDVSPDELTCALARDGGLWCWGPAFYDLGLDRESHPVPCSATPSTAPHVPAPARIDGIPALSAFANGSDHLCGVADGKILCWGERSRMASASPYQPAKTAGVVLRELEF